MAPKGIFEIVTMLSIVAILSAGTMAQSGCTSVLISMASCLNYVTGSAATPSTSCCSALANVVQTQPRCLCTIVNGAVNGPAMSPVGSPESSTPDGSPASPTTPSVTGSKTVPSSATTSNGSATKMNLQLVAVFFVSASYATSAAFNNIIF
ncbi:hypothetical protein DH2020_049062 [Rehmannia glutinosa]|uniref:Bifunctional inhibitor/plant lipid transfer protein/seed storage helical domain-containing protein n=1 Tax=Rehmannia glutinosa TaxID=99300 RepID=A0ABR0U407_REHGL